MHKIMFVCHGNICRSPMAEFVMKDLVKKCGKEVEFYISSSATSTEEIWQGVGNPVYPPAKRELLKHGITCDGKRAVQLKADDYEKYDVNNDGEIDTYDATIIQQLINVLKNQIQYVQNVNFGIHQVKMDYYVKKHQFGGL